MWATVRLVGTSERLEALSSAALDMKMHIEVKLEKHEAVCAVDDAFISCWVGRPALHRRQGWLGCRHAEEITVMMLKNGTHAREFLSSGLQSRALVSDRERQRQLRRHSEDECEWIRESALIRPV